MTMKDISAIDELERAVRDDPALLEAVDDRLHEQLESGVPSKRMDAGRALRAAAEHDPELVADHEETLTGFLTGDNDSLRLSGAIGIAELSGRDPEGLEHAVPQLLTAFEGTVAPSIEEAIIRALTRIGMADPEAVSVADPVIAARLDDATFTTQTVIVRSFVGAVAERPGLFEETTAAYVDALDSDREVVARQAVEALALVAGADPAAIPSKRRVLERSEELRAATDADPRPAAGRGLEAAARALSWAIENEHAKTLNA